MLKTLTLSVTFALALGFSGVAFAGHGCDTCGLASPQGGPVASAQGYTETCDTCTTKKKHCFSMPKFSMPACLKPKPKVYTYEWVLKKKKVHGHAGSSCETCGTGTTVTPSAQYSSPQAMAAPQAYPAAQTASYMASPEMKPAAPTGDLVPPAPAAPATIPPAPPAPSAAQGSLLFLAPTGN